MLNFLYGDFPDFLFDTVSLMFGEITVIFSFDFANSANA